MLQPRVRFCVPHAGCAPWSCAYTLQRSQGRVKGPICIRHGLLHTPSQRLDNMLNMAQALPTAGAVRQHNPTSLTALTQCNLLRNGSAANITGVVVHVAVIDAVVTHKPAHDAASSAWATAQTGAKKAASSASGAHAL